MRISRLVSAVVIAPMAFSLIAAGEGDPEPVIEYYEACANPGGATVITPTQGFNGVVPTPIGAGFSLTTEDAGTYIVDLAGRPKGSAATLYMALDWDLPLVGDYDLVIDGTNDFAVDQPELHSQPMGHCQTIHLETEVFIGTPVDELTLDLHL